MTTQDAQALKFGSRVWYAGRAALVQRVSRNGVTVSFDGMGLKAGQLVTVRVAARDLSARMENA